jgi:hypothetical protein
MSIIRSPRLAQDFTIISNATVRDSRLSYRASGVLADLLSRPDNWRTDSVALSRARPSGEGRDAVRKALAELETHGYIVRTKVRDDLGRWSTASMVYDTPRSPEEISAGHSHDGKPGVGQPAIGPSGPIRSTETKDLEEVGPIDSDAGLVGAGSSLRDDRAPEPTTKPRVKKRKPLTKAEFNASWRRFLEMDLEDLDDDRDIRGAAFLELTQNHGIYEPDKFAADLIDKGQWSSFCVTADLGNVIEVEWTK